MPIATINPATGQTVRTFQPLSDEQLEARLQCAADAYRRYRRTTFAERSRMMLKAAEILESEKEALGRLMVTEMGKPLKAAIEEAAKSAWGCRYYAENAERFLADEEVKTTASRSYVTWQPIGPVLAIMPWNFPFWQVFRFAAPALAAGNVGVLKHSSNVPGCSLAIEEVLRDAGFPEGCFQALLAPSSAVPDIIADPRIRAVTLTGSEGAGSKVAERAGRELKKTVLELGGSDPFIVLEDADLDEAARVGAQSRTINSGQSCIAAKRFIVHTSRLDEFTDRMRSEMEKLRVGDPFDRKTDVGPLAREDLVKDLARQVEESVARGARLVCGGKALDRPGYYYAPTVLAGARKGMPAWDEETFGPVAALAGAKDDAEAVRLANETRYGLGASLWTRSAEKAKDLARRIDAGAVFVNGLVKSDPRLPFGGIKKSGYGRELSVQGMREFLNAKTVWVR
jgi:succinate-semialdehyde dehydrogenase/glutarate-semialdehyde dehydrogenase